MSTIRAQESPAFGAALDALDPRRWGCEPHGDGWTVAMPGLGDVRIARLGWRHARNDASDDGAGSPNALDFLARLQGEVWGMPPDEWVPANILSILPDTGGAVLAAYRADAGWNHAGWLGFLIGAGGRDGTLVSHMLGVRPEVRGGAGVGWLLKAIQAWLAVREGHRAAIWTYDPMRGANARLNLEKLGATVSTLTLDKYGAIRSELYGNVPSDRFTVDWDLLSPAVHARLADVHAGRWHGPTAEEVHAIPLAAPDSDAPAVRFEIPGDIDRLNRDAPEAAAAWRVSMRDVLGALLDTVDAAAGSDPADPATTTVSVRTGRYTIDRFHSAGDDPADRRNWYLLTRRPSPG